MKTTAILMVWAWVALLTGCAAEEPFRPPASHPAAITAQEAPVLTVGESLIDNEPRPDPMPPEMKRHKGMTHGDGMQMPMKEGGVQ